MMGGRGKGGVRGENLLKEGAIKIEVGV